MDILHDPQSLCAKCGAQINRNLNLDPINVSVEPTQTTNTRSAYSKLLEDGTTKLLEQTSDQQKAAGTFNLYFETKDDNNREIQNLQDFDLNFKMSHVQKRPPIDLQFSDISYCVPNGWRKGSKSILKGISGRFLSGEISAILGPSGAGKTTLLNILSGFRTSHASGDIMVNGNPRCLESFQKQSCYIMQDNPLHPYLTIQESMEVAATLKLGNNVSKSAKLSLIQEILETLKLEECQNTMVSNLSGGEKKRLSIALELANNPPVMFLDEPTSGLDSQNSYLCINLLKKLAKEGHNIICTIHQPSARLFEMFDYVYTLAEGQCIYKGTISDLMPFMSSLDLACPPFHNPSDFLIEVASMESGNHIKRMVQAINCRPINDSRSPKQELEKMNLEFESKSNEELMECDKSTLIKDEDTLLYPASLWVQFYVLLIRTFRSVFRDPMLNLLQFAAYLVVGIIFGLIFYKIGNEASKVQSNVGCLFLTLVFVQFTSLMITVLTFPLEMNIYIREHFNNWYSMIAYYCARTIVEIPFQLTFTVLFISLVYYMTNQPAEISRYLSILVIGILTSSIAQGIGLAIGAACDAQKAVYVGAAVLVPMCLFSCFFASYSTIPAYLRWMTYLSYSRYVYQSSMRIIYGNEREQLNCSETFCMFTNPKQITENFEIEDQSFYIDILYLFSNFLIFRILGCLIFRWRLRSQR